MTKYLSSRWKRETEYTKKLGEYSLFQDFCRWISQNHYYNHLTFRSEISLKNIAEGWFESELKTIYNCIFCNLLNTHTFCGTKV